MRYKSVLSIGRLLQSFLCLFLRACSVVEKLILKPQLYNFDHKFSYKLQLFLTVEHFVLHTQHILCFICLNMIFQVLGYLEGLSSVTVVTEDMMLWMYSLTTFIMVGMSIMVTGKAYLSDAIVCTLNTYEYTKASQAIVLTIKLII